MSAPAVAATTLEVYGQLPTTFTTPDADNGYPLLLLVDAQASTWLQPTADIVREDDAGNVGWSVLFDLNRCPTKYLPWLGQFVGVDVDTRLTDAEQRTQIRRADGQSRGGLDAIVAAVERLLTGSQTVIARTRVSGDPYHMQIVTWTSETPNPSAVTALLASPLVKPIGYLIDYLTEAGEDYETVRTSYATYADVKATFPTYANLRDATP